MNINIFKNYYLTTNINNHKGVTLVKTVVKQSGKNKGEEYNTAIGYYSDTRNALLGLYGHVEQTSEATTIEELLKDLNELYEAVNASHELLSDKQDEYNTAVQSLQGNK